MEAGISRILMVSLEALHKIERYPVRPRVSQSKSRIPTRAISRRIRLKDLQIKDKEAKLKAKNKELNQNGDDTKWLVWI